MITTENLVQLGIQVLGILVFIRIGQLKIGKLKIEIGSLKGQIDKQSQLLENTERFMQIFDLNRIEQYVRINYETSKRENEVAIAKAIKEVQEKSQKTFEKYENEWRAAFSFSLAIIYRLPKNKRIYEEIENLNESSTKTSLKDSWEDSERRFDNIFKGKTDFVTTAMAQLFMSGIDVFSLGNAEKKEIPK